MKDEVYVDVKIAMRWWWPLYLHGMIAFCQFTGCKPDADKVTAFIAKRAIKVVVQ